MGGNFQGSSYTVGTITIPITMTSGKVPLFLKVHPNGTALWAQILDGGIGRVTGCNMCVAVASLCGGDCLTLPLLQRFWSPLHHRVLCGTYPVIRLSQYHPSCSRRGHHVWRMSLCCDCKRCRWDREPSENRRMCCTNSGGRFRRQTADNHPERRIFKWHALHRRPRPNQHDRVDPIFAVHASDGPIGWSKWLLLAWFPRTIKCNGSYFATFLGHRSAISVGDKCFAPRW